jgi:hypothetical protein
MKDVNSVFRRAVKNNQSWELRARRWEGCHLSSQDLFTSHHLLVHRQPKPPVVTNPLVHVEPHGAQYCIVAGAWPNFNRCGVNSNAIAGTRAAEKELVVESASEGHMSTRTADEMELVWLSQLPRVTSEPEPRQFPLLSQSRHHNSPTMDFDDYCGPEWEPWRFDMTVDDFWPLVNEFNTVPSAIQTYGDFCDDFERIARDAENADDFRKGLDAHRKIQLRFYKTSLENISQEVGISHSHIPSGLWNALLDLVSQNPLIKPVDELG